MDDWLRRPIADIANAVAGGVVSAEELARAAVARIEADDPKYGAFLARSADEAIAQARAVDARRARGEALGKLAGVPVGLKDALCTRGVPTTCASSSLPKGLY